MVHSPNGYNSHGCPRLTPGTSNFIWVSYVGGRCPSAWVIFCCSLSTPSPPPGTFAGRWIRNAPWDSIRHSDMRCWYCKLQLDLSGPHLFYFSLLVSRILHAGIKRVSPSCLAQWSPLREHSAHLVNGHRFSQEVRTAATIRYPATTPFHCFRSPSSRSALSQTCAPYCGLQLHKLPMPSINSVTGIT